jgi:hypothetical protein
MRVRFRLRTVLVAVALLAVGLAGWKATIGRRSLFPPGVPSCGSDDKYQFGAWSRRPGTIEFAAAVRADLWPVTLVVTDPSGKLYWGQRFSGSPTRPWPFPSSSREVRDRVVTNLAPGLYYVDLRTYYPATAKEELRNKFYVYVR